MNDAVEKVARLLDPQSWRVMDEGLASMLRKHRGQNIGYDPENFKHPQSIKRADEIIDTLKSLGWLSPADIKARDSNWQDDPAADERWNAGVDYAQQQLCKVLGVDPATVNWDAATETLDGDVQHVIHGIITKALGDDWQDLAARDAEVTRTALEMAAEWHEEETKELTRLLEKGNANTSGETQMVIERIVHRRSKTAILALAPPATGMKLVPVETKNPPRTESGGLSS